jgi:hypothetical protein
MKGPARESVFRERGHDVHLGNGDWWKCSLPNFPTFTYHQSNSKQDDLPLQSKPETEIQEVVYNVK